MSITTFHITHMWTDSEGKDHKQKASYIGGSVDSALGAFIDTHVAGGEYLWGVITIDVTHE